MKKQRRKRTRGAEENAPSAQEIETMLMVLNRAHRNRREGMTSDTRNAAGYAFQNAYRWFTKHHIAIIEDEKTGIWKLGAEVLQKEECHEPL